MRRSPRAGGWSRSRWSGANAGWILLATVGVGSLVGPASGLAQQEPAGGSSGTHEVRRGDTLWDLAGRFLSNPFLWPRIYQLNADVVEDPHWIYPGELLRLPAGVARDATRVSAGAVTEVQVAAQPDVPPPSAQEARRPSPQERQGVSGFGGASVFDRSPTSGDIMGNLDVEPFSPSPLVSSSDFLRAPFLAEPTAVGPTAVTARKIEENPLRLSMPPAIRQHDRVVLALQGLPTEEGAMLQAVRWGHRIGLHGRVASPVALLRVTSVRGDSARAVVARLFDNYHVGDPILPAEPFTFDGGSRRVRVEEGLVAGVLGFEVKQVLVGRGDLLFLDAGSAAGVRLGDEFAVFSPREGRPATASLEDRLAVVRVVRLGPNTSTAMVVDLQDTGAAPGSPARLAYRAGGG
ncbi:MAG: LysM peptidoglycan-binding domain-containing protein [Gemmatimonadota bacterium]